mmetsp:Transcript_12786/g.29772  ORF Transcript_12786/g.29772 Transcript_12786/m.29772 type:complete len:255 (+) Transcript_12786:344-1108(+)
MGPFRRSRCHEMCREGGKSRQTCRRRTTCWQRGSHHDMEGISFPPGKLGPKCDSIPNHHHGHYHHCRCSTMSTNSHRDATARRTQASSRLFQDGPHGLESLLEAGPRTSREGCSTTVGVDDQPVQKGGEPRLSRCRLFRHGLANVGRKQLQGCTGTNRKVARGHGEAQQRNLRCQTTHHQFQCRSQGMGNLRSEFRQTSCCGHSKIHGGPIQKGRWCNQPGSLYLHECVEGTQSQGGLSSHPSFSPVGTSRETI